MRPKAARAVRTPLPVQVMPLLWRPSSRLRRLQVRWLWRRRCVGCAARREIGADRKAHPAVKDRFCKGGGIVDAEAQASYRRCLFSLWRHKAALADGSAVFRATADGRGRRVRGKSLVGSPSFRSGGTTRAESPRFRAPRRAGARAILGPSGSAFAGWPDRARNRALARRAQRNTT